MIQHEINWPPASHSGDPEPARDAERQMNASGKRKIHAEIVLDCVATYPGLTALEYGERTTLGHIETQRRLSDLARIGEIEKGEASTYQGRRMSTWHPT